MQGKHSLLHVGGQDIPRLDRVSCPYHEGFFKFRVLKELDIPAQFLESPPQPAQLCFRKVGLGNYRRAEALVEVRDYKPSAKNLYGAAITCPCC
ncbi:MAG: hypothetical protein QGG01_03210, partial [Roseibacillus sp.]|nr:hypothetical protein [Roseibacillus sp.]